MCNLRSQDGLCHYEQSMTPSSEAVTFALLYFPMPTQSSELALSRVSLCSNLICFCEPWRPAAGKYEYHQSYSLFRTPLSPVEIYTDFCARYVPKQICTGDASNVRYIPRPGIKKETEEIARVPAHWNKFSTIGVHESAIRYADEALTPRISPEKTGEQCCA